SEPGAELVAANGRRSGVGHEGRFPSCGGGQAVGPVGAPVRSVWAVVGALRGARAVHPSAGHTVRIPTTVGRIGGAGLERVLPLADSGQCCLLCLARRKGAEQGVARRGWATSRVMLLEGRGRLGTDLFDDKSAGALWALDRLPGDVLPPSFPWSAHRGEVDPELGEVLGALAAHGHGGPERVWGRRRCAAKALCSEWGWLREHAPDPPDAGGGPGGGSLPVVGTES